MGKSSSLVVALLSERRRVRRADPKRLFWPWIGTHKRGTVPRKVANKYLLYCILDYQMQPGTAERNVRRFIDDVLKDPADLWDALASIPQQQWASRFSRYGLHRLRQAHAKVHSIARVMVRDFEGDARRLWRSRDAKTTLHNLRAGLTLGPELSRMAVLGLLENRIVSGEGEVKADLRVRRVLGRVVRGKGFGTGETDVVHATIGTLCAKNAWKLDLPLYQIGYDFCWQTKPACDQCPLRGCCRYAKS